jgi:type I restriction enzyme S subunit
MSNATTIDVIYSEPLKSVRLPLPPIQEQHEILSWTNQELIKIDTLLKTIHKSIPRVFNSQKPQFLSP